MRLQIALTQELEWMVNAQVDCGLYQSASELVREALRDFFTLRSVFSPEQAQWIRESVGPQLEAVKNGTAKLIDGDTFFETLEAKYS